MYSTAAPNKQAVRGRNLQPGMKVYIPVDGRMQPVTLIRQTVAMPGITARACWQVEGRMIPVAIVLDGCYAVEPVETPEAF
jgi:N-glycosylase/DNA lyase